jgi:hypothetical protein
MEDFNFASGWQKNRKEKVAEQKFSVALVIIEWIVSQSFL